MRGSRIEIEVIFFYVFAVIAFGPGKSEQTLLEDDVAAIPQRQREANSLVAITDPADAVFSPAIGARTRMLMRKIFPGRSVRTVILPDRTPLPLAQIRSPALPVLGALVRFLQTLFFGGHGALHSGPVRGKS